MTDLPTGFLLLPTEGDVTFARLQRKVRLLALRRLLSAPLGALGPRLVALARRRSAVLLEALGSPDVLCAILVLHQDLRPAAPLLAQLVPDLLAALPPRSLLETLQWEQAVPSIHIPRLGVRVTFSPPAQAMVADQSGLSFALSGGRRWSPGEPAPEGVVVEEDYHALHPSLPRLHLACWDTNPLSMDEAHPDKEGNRVDLGGRSVSEWVGSLRSALELIEEGLPEWWGELPRSLERLVPVGFEPERHLSASYQEAPNMAYLTLHPDILTLAEAIIHETQHGRLNRLMLLDAVLENGRSAWTSSPVRPDMRPLSGVLLAAHAFVPVAALHTRLAAAGHPLAEGPHFAKRRAEVWQSNAAALETLSAMAEPTAAGKRLLVELGRLHQATMFHVEHHTSS